MWVFILSTEDSVTVHFKFAAQILENDASAYLKVGDMGVMNLHKCKEVEPEYWLPNGKTGLGEHVSQQCNRIEIKGMGFRSERESRSVGSSQMIPPFLLVLFSCRHLGQLQSIKYPSLRRSSLCACDPCVHGHPKPLQNPPSKSLYQTQIPS